MIIHPRLEKAIRLEGETESPGELTGPGLSRSPPDPSANQQWHYSAPEKQEVRCQKGL